MTTVGKVTGTPAGRNAREPMLALPAVTGRGFGRAWAG